MLRRATRTPSVLLPILALVCCRTRAEDPVILSLGDQAVRRSDFERYLRSMEAVGGTALDSSVRRALLEPFLEERILVLEARARGMLPPDGSPEAEQQAVAKLLSEVVQSRIEVPEEEITAYYGAHGEEFRLPETVTLRQILVPTENEARDTRRRALRDPRSFELLARSRSHSPEASRGGLMGTFARGQLPAELEAPAFALGPGGTSDVVATPMGFHVIRVDARQASRERSLEECRSEIRTLLLRRKSDQGVRQFVQGLLARAKVNHEAADPHPRDS